MAAVESSTFTVKYNFKILILLLILILLKLSQNFRGKYLLIFTALHLFDRDTVNGYFKDKDLT